MLAGVVVVLKTALGVLGISERVKRAAKQVLLRLHTLLQVGVLGEREVPKKKVVPGQSYTNISNICIINIQILYLFNRRSSRITNRS